MSEYIQEEKKRIKWISEYICFGKVHKYFGEWICSPINIRISEYSLHTAPYLLRFGSEGVIKIFPQRMIELINELINEWMIDRGVYRTALSTPGLLIIFVYMLFSFTCRRLSNPISSKDLWLFIEAAHLDWTGRKRPNGIGLLGLSFGHPSTNLSLNLNLKLFTYHCIL